MSAHNTSEQDDIRFMREALAQAQRAAAAGEVPIGAVVVCEGKVVARAHNRRELDEDPSAHAEFSAMVEAARKLGRWRLTGCTVYVTLEPCLMCAGLMVNARIDRCVYGATDPKGGAVGTLFDVSADERLNHAFAVTSGVLEDECASVLRDFFAGLRASRKDSTGALDVAEAPACGCGHAAPPAPRPASRLPHVLLAVDSFKGSASSMRVEAWIAEGIRRARSGAEVTCLPVADGGEGTVAALYETLGGELRTLTVTGPMGQKLDASYLLVRQEGADGPLAVIEMAQAAGVGATTGTADAALSAGTYGVGELLLDAVAQGARSVCLGLGGSATTDGGVGMLQALGARIEDIHGDPVSAGLAGVAKVEHVSLGPARKALAGMQIKVLSDVRSPLVGPRGAVRTFGAQKGLANGLDGQARERALAEYDGWMAAYGAKLTAARDALDGTSLQVAAAGERPKSIAGVPGAGAAGGLGAALLALGCELVPGVDALLDLQGFDKLVATADIVVTGEGSLDAQTAEGKLPVGVARRAKRAKRTAPVVAVCGQCADDLAAVYDQGIDVVLPALRRPVPLERAMTEDELRANLIAAGETVVRMMGLVPGR